MAKKFNPEKELANYSKITRTINEIKEKEVGQITFIKEKIARQTAPWLEKEKALKKELKAYFTKHKRTIFQKIKSLVYTVATVGFRRTPPKLDIPKDQSAVIALIKKKMTQAEQERYITTTAKLNIEVLEKTPATLQFLGIKWKSRDQFYIDINKNPATIKVKA